MEVCADVCSQVGNGNATIFGAMVESHLVAGRQEPKPDQPLTYGQSITDACIGWDDSERLLRDLANAVAQRRALAKVRA